MRPTIVYVDGFNLYYGALKRTPNKWLNVRALAEALLPQHRIVAIRYFTAKVDPRPKDPDQPIRQLAYLRALGTLPDLSIHYGTFQTKPARLPKAASVAAGAPVFADVLRAEEKGSDVNLASWLLLDAFRKLADCAVVMSNDSDLLTPLSMARNELGILVGALLPRQGGSVALKNTVNFWKPIRQGVTEACQYPPVLEDNVGTILKPAGW